jgi:hypothetical protein
LEWLVGEKVLLTNKASSIGTVRCVLFAQEHIFSEVASVEEVIRLWTIRFGEVAKGCSAYEILIVVNMQSFIGTRSGMLPIILGFGR